MVTRVISTLTGVRSIVTVLISLVTKSHDPLSVSFRTRRKIFIAGHCHAVSNAFCFGSACCFGLGWLGSNTYGLFYAESLPAGIVRSLFLLLPIHVLLEAGAIDILCLSAAASSRGTAVEDEEFPGSRRGRSGTPASAKGARTASSTSCGRRKVSGCSSTLRITDVQRVLPLRQGKLGPVFSYGSSSQGSLVHEAELSFEALLPSGRFCPESFYFVT